MFFGGVRVGFSDMVESEVGVGFFRYDGVEVSDSKTMVVTEVKMTLLCE